MSNETFSVIFKHRGVQLFWVHISNIFRLPLGQLFVALAALYQECPCSKWWNAIKFRVLNNAELRTQPSRLFFAKAGIATEHYAKFAMETERADPHAIYPTNIYRQCDGCTIANNDYSTIESVMSTTLTTTIKIRKRVLEVDNDTLSKIYKPLGRCIAIIDDKVFEIYGDQIHKYFDHHDVEFKALVYKGNEVDKEIGNVETILVDLKTYGVSRNEPILIMGGGVISDIGGFACGLYHRSTPYVMLCTSIVSGIDAGPSPRTCCDGFGFKNLYGAYHPPIQTITDRFFFQSLKTGWIRHGIAEIIKMSVTKDFQLFELLEKAGSRLIDTKFGTEMVEPDQDFEDLCDLIIGRALDSYVKSEVIFVEQRRETHLKRRIFFFVYSTEIYGKLINAVLMLMVTLGLQDTNWPLECFMVTPLPPAWVLEPFFHYKNLGSAKTNSKGF